ncbi:MAG: sensor histidine kinase, partial [Vicinamibacterales bacterium]
RRRHRGATRCPPDVAVVGRRPGDASPDVDLQLFRIAQEAVTNATRHAQARHIVIALNQDPDGVTLRVTDNGIGMTTKTNERGMGLHSMQARARLLGGRATIASRRRRGTCVTCWVPHRGSGL